MAAREPAALLKGRLAQRFNNRAEERYSFAGAGSAAALPPRRPLPLPRAPPPPRGRRAGAVPAAAAAAAPWASPASDRHLSQIRCDVTLNSPGSITRAITLLHREQIDVCQTDREGCLKVPMFVVFSPGPIRACPIGAFVADAFPPVYQKRA